MEKALGRRPRAQQPECVVTDPQDDGSHVLHDGSGGVVWAEDIRMQVERTNSGEGLAGNLLDAYGSPLPPGAAILTYDEDGDYLFAGLVSGKATLEGPGGRQELFAFAGVDRIREMLLVPQRYPVDERAVYRPDDITVIQEIK